MVSTASCTQCAGFCLLRYCQRSACVVQRIACMVVVMVSAALYPRCVSTGAKKCGGIHGVNSHLVRIVVAVVLLQQQ